MSLGNHLSLSSDFSIQPQNSLEIDKINILHYFLPSAPLLSSSFPPPNIANIKLNGTLHKQWYMKLFFL